MDDDIQYASTSNASSCATPKFVDYLHSTIVAGKSCFRLLNFCVLMWFIFHQSILHQSNHLIPNHPHHTLMLDLEMPSSSAQSLKKKLLIIHPRILAKPPIRKLPTIPLTLLKMTSCSLVPSSPSNHKPRACPTHLAGKSNARLSPLKSKSSRLVRGKARARPSYLPGKSNAHLSPVKAKAYSTAHFDS